MSKEMSHTFESALAYIHGSNESVAMVDDILAQLRSMAQSEETVRIDTVQRIVSDAFLKHTGVGKSMQRTLNASNE